MLAPLSNLRLAEGNEDSDTEKEEDEESSDGEEAKGRTREVGSSFCSTVQVVSVSV